MKSLFMGIFADLNVNIVLPNVQKSFSIHALGSGWNKTFIIMMIKRWIKIAGAISLMLCLFSAISHAQTTNDSVVAWEANLAELPTISLTDVPRSGTFWVITSPNGRNGGVTAPYPSMPPGIDSTNLFSLPDGSILADGTGGNDGASTEQLAAQIMAVSNVIARAEQTAMQFSAHANGRRAMANSGPPIPSGGGGTNTLLQENDYTVPDYGTNLWIAQCTLTNGVMTGIASNTLADVEYELLTNSDLTTTNWGHSGIFIYGSEATNWTALAAINVNPTNNLFFRLFSYLSSDGSGLPDWWEQEYGVSDPYGNPAGDGYNNLYKYQHGMNPTVFYTPAAPQGLTAVYNPSLGAAIITWLPSSGAVTDYTLTTPTGSVTLSATTTSYTNYNSNFGLGLSGYQNVEAFYSTGFQLKATYAEGDSLPENVNLKKNFQNIWLIQGAQGSNYLAVSALLPGTAAIRLSREDTLAELSYGDYSFNTSNDIPLANFTNGLCYLPPGLTTSPADAYTNIYYDWWAQAVDSNGVATSYIVSLGENTVNNADYGIIGVKPLYLDGRRQLKDNLKFLFRAAGIDQSFGYHYNDDDIYISRRPRTFPSNYAYASFYDAFDSSTTAGGFGFSKNTLPQLDVFAPFADNTLYQNCVFNFSIMDTDGNLTSGIHFDPYVVYPFFTPPLAYQFTQPNVSGTTIPAYGPGQTNWLITQVSFYENGSTNTGDELVLLSGQRNIFGLPFTSAEIAWGNTVADTLTLYPGESTTNGGNIFAGPAQPQLQTVEYDFWNYNYGNWSDSNIWYPLDVLPEEDGFSPTNKTSQALIVGVGSSIQVVGYAKQELLNGYDGVYGYLGQYFDQAYQTDTNGNATTTPTGVLSPYGSFFATEPGNAALVTLPDIDNTSERGTGIVHCVSLQVDKNHDGTMDLSWNGPDATSQSNPFKIWVNNDYDFSFGSDNPLGQDVESQYNANYKDPSIDCPRDLEDWFRLWICGMPALTNGYQVTLSWDNVSTGSPAINLVNAVETNGGTLYLTDTNTAMAQCADYLGEGYGQKYKTVSTANSLTLPASLFASAGNKYFLFEGAGIGAGELILTISDSNGNPVAWNSVWLDLHDVKDLYEQAHISNVLTTYPAMVNATNTSTFVSDHELPANLAESNQMIVFVHGWRMALLDYYSFSESMFKRLYWSGYQGRFAALRWPTFSTDTVGDLTQYFTYNRSEHIAFDSGMGACAYFDWLKSRLPDYSINVAAHSMGNIVMMETLKNQLAEGHSVIDNYVLMQAAVPAHCYDPSLPDYSRFTVAEASGANKRTPDVYRGFPGNIAAAVNGNMINFFNTNDYALATGTKYGFQANWEANQVDNKPDSEWSYTSNGTNCYCYYGGYRIVTDPIEKMPFIARPRSKAVGALEDVGGQIDGGQLDLTSTYNFRGASDEHSAQFNWSIQQLGGMTNGFYKVLIQDLTQ